MPVVDQFENDEI